LLWESSHLHKDKMENKNFCMVKTNCRNGSKTDTPNTHIHDKYYIRHMAFQKWFI